ncbi:MAG: hypothetical protein ACTHJK_07095 [Sphingomicrobium sp.]|jgi:hypothetical protein
MNDMHLALERSGEAVARVTVSRSDGSEVAVRLRLLGYDGCEFESDRKFAVGEQVSIHLYRMGSIRALIVSRHRKVIEARFDNHSPV